MKNYVKKSEIDVVITWVDGSDREWLEEKKKFDSGINIDDSIERYRDVGTLKYVLRSIEKFAPWVRKIFLVTCGHLPTWLNEKHEKIEVVKHSDFIPKEYLPTFSSHPIEWNLHRIEGLSENFIYFNDDMILTRKTKPEDFFKNNLPCDSFALNMICPKDLFTNILFNNVTLINKHFIFKDTIIKNRKKIFSILYGKRMFLSIVLSLRNGFYGFYDHHGAISFRKKYFSILWEKEKDAIDKTCLNKFRSKDDISIWLIRYWQLCEGFFMKRDTKFARTKSLDYFINENKYLPKKQKCLCVNDIYMTENKFFKAKINFEKEMDKILGEKSAFEK